VAGVTLLLGSSIPAVDAATFKVNCNKGQSIQHRLDNNAKNGDTIKVSGDCSETIDINLDNLILAGAGPATTSIDRPDAEGSVIRVRGRNVRISGFTITGGRDGISVIRGGSAEILDNVIKETGRAAVLVTDGGHALIQGNVLKKNTREGIRGEESSALTIIDNDIEDNRRDGIVLNRNVAAILDDNDIIGNRNGIAMFTSSVLLGNVFPNANVGNRIKENDGFGIFCTGFSRIRVAVAQDVEANDDGDTNASTDDSCILSGSL
jgi:nitrous oxidase accessory protein NosD